MKQREEFVCAGVRRVIAAAIAPCFIAASALAQSPAAPANPAPFGDASLRVIVLDTLEQQSVSGLWFDQNAMQFRDAQGRPQRLERRRVLAVAPPAPTGPRADRHLDALAAIEAEGLLVTTSGERLPGALHTEPASDDEQLAWQSTLWGVMELDLERIRSVRLRDIAPGVELAEPAERSAADDRITLINADRLSGFVESIGEQVVIESEGRISSVPSERVAKIELANPAEAAAGAWVWLYSGAVAAVESVQLSGDEAQARLIAAAGRRPAIELPASDIRAINFDVARLRPLAVMPFAVIDAPGSRRWVPPPRVHSGNAPLDAADIELPGPMTVEWDLPPAAERFAAMAELPADSRIWGDLTLVLDLSRGGETTRLGAFELNQSTPRHDLNLLLPAGRGETTRLLMRIEPGPSGPIQDRVVLRRALVLVRK